MAGVSPAIHIRYIFKRGERMASTYAGTVRAPEFPPGLEWFNSRSLSRADLRGKLVILDFWTYG